MEYYSFLGNDIGQIKLATTKANSQTKVRIRLASGDLVEGG